MQYAPVVRVKREFVYAVDALDNATPIAVAYALS